MNSTANNSGLASLVDPEQHPGALEQAAIAALSAGDLKQAYRLADRRCRIPPTPEARHYTLRAEIAHRRGLSAAALADVAKALELAPDDHAANRRMMQWGQGKEREDAARRLLTIDHDFDALSAAIAALKSSDQGGFGAIRRVGDTVTGWVAWHGRNRPRLRIEREHDIESITIESDPEHPLAQAADHATNFKLPFVRGNGRSVVSLLLGAQELARQVLPASVAVGRPAAISVRGSNQVQQVRVIVPVYDDFDATRRCLESLMRAVEHDDTVTIILVDDATPDKRIATLVDRMAAHSKVQLLRNPHNLGFIGSVNRALKTIADGDVILLNSDTVLGDGFVARLKATAHASPDIGTVTPLSNNGEATSLPVPFKANPLPDDAQVERLDSIAAQANAGQFVDMPDGIGFCLYIKRACLDAVGGLSEHYHRGYLEDVDLCLRAREHGFRNVCATSVFVAHAGSASFKAEKRALVMLNLERLRLRFPGYRTESSVFQNLDPLRVRRAGIERNLMQDHRGGLLVVSGPGAPANVAAEFARTCERPAVIATLAGSRLDFRDSRKGFPQSLSFALPGETADLTQSVEDLAPSRVVCTDPARVSPRLVQILARPGAAIDLVIADGGLWCHRGGIAPEGRTCCSLTSGKSCDCDGGRRRAQRDWLALLTSESRIIAPDPIAAAFLGRRLPAAWTKRIKLAGSADAFRRAQRPRTAKPQGNALGLLPLGHAPADFSLMRRLACRIRQTRPDAQIVVIGTTVDDLALMALGNVAVTGAFGIDELQTMIEHYELGGLAVMRRAPLFGHPVLAAAFSKLAVPLAFVDWSFGRVGMSEGDLAIAPEAEENSIVAEIADWSAEW